MIAQSDTIDNSIKSNLGYHFNPNISFGIGGTRPFGYFPQASIKLGRIEFGATPFIGIKGAQTATFQLDVETYLFLGLQNKKANVTIGLGGYLLESRADNITTNIEAISFLGGVNQTVGKRSRVSLKIGTLGKYTLGYIGEYDYRYPDNNLVVEDSKKWYPYGEISYKLYLLPLTDKPLVRASEPKEKVRIDPEDVKIDWVNVKSFFRDYFNPYWSVGAGLDRAYLVTPGGGIKIGPVQVDASGMFLGESFSGGAKITINVFKLGAPDGDRRYVTLGASAAGIGEYLSGSSVYSITTGMMNYSIDKRHSVSFNVGLGRWSSYSGDDYPFGDEDYVDQSTSDSGWMPTVGISYNIYLFKFRN